MPATLFFKSMPPFKQGVELVFFYPSTVTLYSLVCVKKKKTDGLIIVFAYATKKAIVYRGE